MGNGGPVTYQGKVRRAEQAVIESAMFYSNEAFPVDQAKALKVVRDACKQLKELKERREKWNLLGY